MKTLDTTIYNILSSDAMLQTMGVRGIYRNVAAIGAALPLIVFFQRSGLYPYRVFTGPVWYSISYVVKAVTEGSGAQSVYDIDTRIAQVLISPTPITNGNWGITSIRRDTDIDFTEVENGRIYQHVGAIYQIEMRNQ